MGKLLCEKNLRDVWCRNESVRAEIGQILQTHRQTHASKLVVEIKDFLMTHDRTGSCYGEIEPNPCNTTMGS